MFNSKQGINRVNGLLVEEQRKRRSEKGHKQEIKKLKSIQSTNLILDGQIIKSVKNVLYRENDKHHMGRKL